MRWQVTAHSYVDGKWRPYSPTWHRWRWQAWWQRRRLMWSDRNILVVTERVET